MRELTFIKEFLQDNQDYIEEKYATKAELTVASKAQATDLLTEVDLTIQSRFVNRISHRYPDDVVLGEEGTFSQLPKDPNARVWIIDPIDGTYNFMRSLFPIFAVSIAFAQQGEVQAGGILFPMQNSFFLSERGSGCYYNDVRMHVSAIQQLHEARLDIDFSRNEGRRALLGTVAPKLFHDVGIIRCLGSAVTAISQVATGDSEAYLHMRLNPWDYAAAQLMVEEAGGVATRLDGSPLRVFDGRHGVLISNGAIHEQLLAKLQ